MTDGMLSSRFCLLFRSFWKTGLNSPPRGIFSDRKHGKTLRQPGQTIKFLHEGKEHIKGETSSSELVA